MQPQPRYSTRDTSASRRGVGSSVDLGSSGRPDHRDMSSGNGAMRRAPSPTVGDRDRGLGSSVRYGTPTSRDALGSSTSLGSGGSRGTGVRDKGTGSRPSTPTKTWRF